MSKKEVKKIVGIDPGKNGYIVILENKELEFFPIPLGPDNLVVTKEIFIVLKKKAKGALVFLEKAKPMAMGSKHAFNYGRDYQSIICALEVSGNPFREVEPNKWSKVMHEGIDSKFTTKVKSELAVRRLRPDLVKGIPVTPRSKKLHDGAVDALLIALYGEMQAKAGKI